MEEMFRRQLARRERVSQGRVLRPVGNKREVVTDEDCGNTKLVSTLTPNASSAPGSIVPILGAGGGSGLVAAESTITGQGVGSEEQNHTLPGLPLLTSSIGLRVTSTSDDEIEVSIAHFFGGKFVSTLFENLVLPGGVSPLSDNSASSMRTARTIVGLDGVSDGSILLRTFNVFPQDPTPPPANPRTITIHVIDIVTGVVHSRQFVLSFPNVSVQLVTTGWNIQDGKFYYMFVAEQESRVELATFPPTLTSQTTLSTPLYDFNEGDIRFGTLFFADDALNMRELGVFDKWDRLPFSGGIDELHVDGVPIDPGRRPYGLGLRRSKYWVMGTGPDSSDRRLRPLFLDRQTNIAPEGEPPIFLPAIDIVPSQGWLEMGPVLGEMFSQGTSAGHDIDDNAMYGFPVNRTPGSVRGFMRLPLTATRWSEASVTIMDTVPFDSDMVLPDRR